LTLMGRKVIYDCHENLPMQILQKDWLPKPVRWMLAPAIWLAEWSGARFLAGVVVARDQVLKRFPRRKAVLVRNYPSPEAVRILSQGIPVEQRRNIVIYTGGISRVRGIAELVEAFREIEIRDAELWLVGEFDDFTFQKELAAKLPANVKWLGWMAHTEVLKLYQHAKLGALLLYPTPSHRNSQPIKLYEYLAAGLPVIATDLPEFAASLEGCAVLVNPLDVQQIRLAIAEILSDEKRISEMSATARQHAASRYSWEPEGQRLLDFCKELIAHG
ncbi:MAG: glycosyltransferase, partial [Candidatus Acidiferrales bacterium]